MKCSGTGDDDADGVNEAVMGKGTGTPLDTSSLRGREMLTALVSCTNEVRPGTGTEKYAVRATLPLPMPTANLERAPSLIARLAKQREHLLGGRLGGDPGIC